jgi:hypothetical protein
MALVNVNEVNINGVTHHFAGRHHYYKGRDKIYPVPWSKGTIKLFFPKKNDIPEFIEQNLLPKINKVSIEAIRSEKDLSQDVVALNKEEFDFRRKVIKLPDTQSPIKKRGKNKDKIIIIPGETIHQRYIPIAEFTIMKENEIKRIEEENIRKEKEERERFEREFDLEHNAQKPSKDNVNFVEEEEEVEEEVEEEEHFNELDRSGPLMKIKFKRKRHFFKLDNKKIIGGFKLTSLRHKHDRVAKHEEIKKINEVNRELNEKSSWG